MAFYDQSRHVYFGSFYQFKLQLLPVKKQLKENTMFALML